MAFSVTVLSVVMLSVIMLNVWRYQTILKKAHC
jgi:hypothetical protein